ncbi:protein eyes shut homolog [Ylistrum balloti]|uniref:protein eyes shut homolog n=1 Tax=Ylistrum balloti TaxID=509963 RepID=UPI002905C2AF|nr:protein eyes shut homolog [Ylistrum balloti]
MSVRDITVTDLVQVIVKIVLGTYRCTCNSGWTGRNCSQDIDECQHNPCEHGGTCNNTIGSYTCACQGFSGHNCENDINECQHTKCPHKNMHCVNSVGSYTCQCNAGWTGDHCDTDVNKCQHNPCLHGGTCHNRVGNYTCQCNAGWTGWNCSKDVNECSFMPRVCNNHGTCINNDGSYTCNCAAGWTDSHCSTDIDECKQHLGKNNATCTNVAGGYICHCNQGWHGSTCSEDINECENNPCQNEATCHNNVGSYECMCTDGWSGHHCDKDINECKLPNRCSGSHTCSNFPGGFLCSGRTESTTSYDLTSSHPFVSQSYVSFISLECFTNVWKIRIYLPELYKRHTDFDPTDIYLGKAGCEGYRSGDYLIINHQYNDCLTRHTLTARSDVYSNTLVYALRDANYEFIIRDYRFRIDLECRMNIHETVSQHFIETQNQVRTRSNNPRISGQGHYAISMTFYTDLNFLHPLIDNYVMTNNPLSADIGEDIYVKLATLVSDPDVKMRVDSCYTLPSPGAGENLKLYLIRNACASDISSRVLYITPHETRFVFRDFEYSTDQDNLYLYCTVTFCNTTDNSSVCDQQCHQRMVRSIVTAPQGYRAMLTTSGVIPRHIGRRRKVAGKPDVANPIGQTKNIGIDGDIFTIAVLVGMMVLSVSAVLLMVRRRLNRESE